MRWSYGALPVADTIGTVLRESSLASRRHVKSFFISAHVEWERGLAAIMIVVNLQARVGSSNGNALLGHVSKVTFTCTSILKCKTHTNIILAMYEVQISQSSCIAHTVSYFFLILLS
jgi:hypothetical protein